MTCVHVCGWLVGAASVWAAVVPFAAPAAYPIEPVPLRRLFVESDLVVVAVPSEIRHEPRDSIATLQVEHLLKGTLVGPTVEVGFQRGLICPSPANYAVDEPVLAFLYRPDHHEGADPPPALYRTSGLSYGSKSLEPAEMVAYVEALRDLVRVYAIPDESHRDAKLADWLVRAVEYDATRGEALMDLYALRVAHLSRRKGAWDIDRLETFSRAHHDRLIDVMARLPGTDSDVATLALLSEHLDDDRLDELILTKLGECARAGPPNMATALDLMDVCARRFEGEASSTSRAGTWRRHTRERGRGALTDFVTEYAEIEWSRGPGAAQRRQELVETFLHEGRAALVSRRVDSR